MLHFFITFELCIPELSHFLMAQKKSVGPVRVCVSKLSLATWQGMLTLLISHLPLYMKASGFCWVPESILICLSHPEVLSLTLSCYFMPANKWFLNFIILTMTSLSLAISWCSRKLILSLQNIYACLDSRRVCIHWFLYSPVIVLFRIKYTASFCTFNWASATGIPEFKDIG